MKNILSTRMAIAALTLVTVIWLAVLLETRVRPGPGPDSLADIRSIETLRREFNRDAGQVRLVILLNPT